MSEYTKDDESEDPPIDYGEPVENYLGELAVGVYEEMEKRARSYYPEAERMFADPVYRDFAISTIRAALIEATECMKLTDLLKP